MNPEAQMRYRIAILEDQLEEARETIAWLEAEERRRRGKNATIAAGPTSQVIMAMAGGIGWARVATGLGLTPAMARIALILAREPEAQTAAQVVKASADMGHTCSLNAVVVQVSYLRARGVDVISERKTSSTAPARYTLSPLARAEVLAAMEAG